MTDEIVKKVRTVFEADMTAMDRALGRAGAEAYRAQQRVQGLQGAFAGLGKYIAGAMGAMAVKSLVAFTSNVESTQMGIASLLKSGDKMRGVMTPFADSAREAADAFAMMRKAAIDTPATTMQVADAFKVLALRARSAGMSTKDLVALSANVATKDMMMGGQGVVGRDIEQLLRGQSGEIATPELMLHRQRLAAMGRAGETGKLFAEVQGLLAVAPDEQKAWGASTGGMFATMQDQWEQFKLSVMQPIMPGIVEGMKSILAWMDQNQEAVKALASAVTTTLGVAFEGVGVIVKGIGVLVKTLAGLFENDVAKGIGIAVAGVGAFTLALNALKGHPVIAAMTLLVSAGAWLDSVLGSSPQDRMNEAKGDFNRAMDLARARRSLKGDAAMVGDDWQAKGLQALQLKELKQYVAASKAVYGDATTFQLDGITVAADEYQARIEAATKALGAGYGMESFRAFEAEQARQKKAQEDAAKATQAFADSVNGITARLAALKVGNPVMEDDGWGNMFASKKWLKLPQMVVNAGVLATTDLNFKAPPNVDARGSRITVNQKITTNDPSRIAGATLVGAFTGAFQRPLSGNAGLGGIGLTGG